MDLGSKHGVSVDDIGDRSRRYEQMLDQAYQKIKETYLIEQSRAFYSRPTKRVHVHRPEHFEWFVCYQIKEMSCPKIYTQYKENCNISTPHTVHKAIRILADDLELDLRYGGRGRRRRKPLFS